MVTLTVQFSPAVCRVKWGLGRESGQVNPTHSPAYWCVGYFCSVLLGHPYFVSARARGIGTRPTPSRLKFPETVFPCSPQRPPSRPSARPGPLFLPPGLVACIGCPRLASLIFEKVMPSDDAEPLRAARFGA